MFIRPSTFVPHARLSLPVLVAVAVVFGGGACDCNDGPKKECGEPGMAPCPDGYECESGKCVRIRPQAEPKPECTSWKDCASGVCKDGKCVACTDDADCPAGMKCVDGTCRKPTPIATVTDPCETLGSSNPDGRIVAYFDFDRYDLREDTRQALDTVAACLLSKKATKIALTGYADARGTEGYNMALGMKRANSASKYLKSKADLKGLKIDTKSRGEEDANQSCSTEGCWQMDRKVLTTIP